MKKTAASLLSLCCAAALAAPAPEAAVKLYLAQETAGLAGRVEISLGTLDARTRPAPCARVEPFLPAGARLWGRTAVGLRCAQGPAWSAWLPVEIRVFAPAWIATRHLSAGQALREGDARLEEVDLTRHPRGLLQEHEPSADQVLAGAVAPGQALRHDHFRPAMAVAAGDLVRVVYSGAGFTVSAEGRALSAAALGQPVRVRTESGRVLSGTARGPRLVELRP
jgi:flagella basal body P-ring formation protein FlgA